MTKLVCISDTHSMHNKVELPEGDILIHCGDFCNRGDSIDVGNFLHWMDHQDYETKIVVPGNHDIILETDEDIRKEFARSGIQLLIDQEFTHKASGLKFYGVPWTPDFHPDIWGFQYRDAPQNVWAKVPEDTDVLLSHGPPFGVADQITPGYSPHLGSKPLADALYDFGSPLTIICGHIHGSYGKHLLDPHTIYNVAVCTELYVPSNTPTVLEL